MMNRICVFCGSSQGSRPEYANAALLLGREIAQRGKTLVYGGADVGLMGTVANAALEAGGEVIGVLPAALRDKEIAHPGLTELHIVSSMHERKAKMVELADAFVSLPGGLGTWDETFEVLTWAQLGFHQKPCGLLNIAAYYDPVVSLFVNACEEGFMRAEHRDMLVIDGSVPKLLIRLEAYRAPDVAKWM